MTSIQSLQERWAPTLGLSRVAPAAPAVEPVEAEPEPATESVSRAFVTTIHGRTLINAPAAAALSVNDVMDQRMLWIHGRFVGADAANRNGAMWTAGDLEMAQGTVINGPLNWLHEERHVIGTLAKADFVPAPETAAEGTTQPHIAATAAVWRWIWPEESYVIEQASDLGKLFYSMECVSREVQCAGPNGCGNSTSYQSYISGAACEHVTQRASVRRFVDPVFLGGAVIVPPAQPGWAEADASVMQEAERFAEAAYFQAGTPAIDASEWEQMMAQIVRFATP